MLASESGFEHLISIHAPCEGGDLQTNYYGFTTYISIHAPCEGGDMHATSVGVTE